MLRRFGKDRALAVRRALVAAMRFKAVALSHMHGGDWVKEAVALYRDIDRRFGKDTDPEIRLWVILSLLEEANMPAGYSGRFDDTLALYRDIDRRYGKDDSPQARVFIIQALKRQTDYAPSPPRKAADREAIFADIERRFGKDSRLEVRLALMEVLAERIHYDYSWAEPGKRTAAFEAYIRNFGEDSRPEVRLLLAKAFADLATPRKPTFRKLSPKRESSGLLSWSGLARLLRRMPCWPDSTGTTVMGERLPIDCARTTAPAFFLKPDKFDEAFALYQALTPYSSKDGPIGDIASVLKMEIRDALTGKTTNWALNGKQKEDAAFWRAIEQRFGSKDPAINALIAETLFSKGAYLALRSRSDNPGPARAAFRELICLFGGSDDFRLQRHVQKAKDTIKSLDAGQRIGPQILNLED